MSRKRKQRRRGKWPSKPTAADARGVDRRGAETLTVVWMLCVTTALACELVALAAAVVTRSVGGGARIIALGELMLFAALVIGLLALGLIPAVARLRSEPPPTGVMVFAAVVGLAPWIIILARQVL